MVESSLSLEAREFLSMAGSEGKLCVRHYVDHFGCPCGPSEQEIELLSKGYLVVGQQTHHRVEYRLTQKAQLYLATQRRTIR